MNAYESAFREALSVANIAMDPSESIVVDDRVHRYKAAGEKEADAWYALHLIPANNGGDALIAGAYGHWARLPAVSWCSRQRGAMSREEAQAANQAYRDINARRAEDERRLHAEAAEKCRSWFSRFPRAEGHMYLMLKGVPACGPLYEFTDELYRGWLALPLQDSTGTIRSAQFIGDDGTKRFCFGGEVKGCYYPVSEVPGGPIIICEGYATGASIYQATGWTVISAMNCGNLLSVGLALRAKFPERTILFAADNDQYTDGNPGLTKAKEAAKKCGGLIASPDFPESITSRLTDFNDLHQECGLDEVKRQIFDAFPVIGRPIGILTAPPKDDPTELLRYRYLCERGGMLFNGPTGVGKSSISIQQSACWCNGLPFFGIYPAKPLRIVVIQAENDDGDVAQMRDGICTGLALNQDQRRTFFERCIIHTATRGLTGRTFCREIVRPLLDLHAPNMLHIDPALSFIGGNVKEQEVVGEFLRVHLNPELFDHQCGCELFHHTNKPLVGKEKANWVNGEWAYSGSGSAEFANWARAILALQSLGVPGYYNLHAGKRGGRLGWTTDTDTDEEAPSYQQPVAWSNVKGLIYWRTPTQDEIPAASSGPGRPDAYNAKDLLDILADSTVSMTTKEWKETAQQELGMRKTSFYEFLKALEDQKLVFQSTINKRWSIIKPSSQSPTE